MRLYVGQCHASSENHEGGESLSSPVDNKQPMASISTDSEQVLDPPAFH